MVALMGPSGAGKTTLLNCIVGRSITGVTEGNVFYDGTSLGKVRSTSRVTRVGVNDVINTPCCLLSGVPLSRCWGSSFRRAQTRFFLFQEKALVWHVAVPWIMFRTVHACTSSASIFGHCWLWGDTAERGNLER